MIIIVINITANGIITISLNFPWIQLLMIAVKLLNIMIALDLIKPHKLNSELYDAALLEFKHHMH